jgi:hypothetical protein
LGAIQAVFPVGRMAFEIAKEKGVKSRNPDFFCGCNYLLFLISLIEKYVGKNFIGGYAGSILR